MNRRSFNTLALSLCSPETSIVSTPPPPESPDALEHQVRAVLEKQVTAWNQADLDTFLETYWKSDELTFYSGGTVLRGWKATRERYRNRYQADGNPMGRLEFASIAVQVVGTDFAFARGEWKLDRSESIRMGGLFTLLIRRFDEGWRIIHDHTSTA